jgi:hypothetical protein
MLSNLINGEINIKEVIATLKNSLFRDHKLSHANPDYHRELRHNLNEVIYGEGKTIEQIIHIAEQLARNKRCVLISRLDENKISALQLTFPNGRSNVLARTFVINPPQELINKQNQKFVAIVSAGTSDIPIAEEAQEVCFAMRIHTRLIPDVGVAGLHRVLNILDVLHQANVIIVIAGMEGALPSVIGGLVGKPIIAVPTSIGYGASLNGLAALLGMLNSCAPGLLVTNIDAGFSAGFAAARIINEMENNENTLSG